MDSVEKIDMEMVIVKLNNGAGSMGGGMGFVNNCTGIVLRECTFE